MVERKRGSDRYDSDDGYDSKRRRGGFIVKVLCPYYTAGAVIGKGGERIKEIKDRSGANIEISRHDARFPNTEERVISIEGERDELQSALRYLNENIRDADVNLSGANSSRYNDDAMLERRKKTCKILVSDSSMAMIIGRGGDNIREIKKEYGVQINTSKRQETPREIDERIVTIEGEDRDVDRCLDELICQICTDDRSRMKFHVDYNEIRYTGRGGGYGGNRYGGGGGGGGRYNRSRSRSRSRPRGSFSPRRRSPSPRRRSPSPRRRSPSPRRRSPSPRRRSPSPRRRSPPPRRRSPSPARGSPSPRRRSISPARKRRSPSNSRSKSRSR